MKNRLVLIPGLEADTIRRRMLTRTFLTLLLILAAIPALGVEPYSIEPAELHPSDSFPPALMSKLDPQGWLLSTESNGLKVSICEVFWVKIGIGQDRQPGTKTQSPYGGLEPGALVGVIYFLPEASEDYREDFHDQKLEPGYYSMRYAPRPKGDPADVLLLSPVRADREAEPVLSQDELERRSRLASHSHEPAVLSLVPAESGKEESPSVRMDDQGTCIFQIKLQVKSGTGSSRESTLAVILVTPRKGEGDAS